MASEFKKSSAIGCFVYLAFIIAAFVWAPWQIALGFVIVSFFIMSIITGIINEFGRINSRKLTPTITIAAASSGTVELFAKIELAGNEITTWLTKQKAAFREIDFQTWKPGKNTETSRGHWSSFFHVSSEKSKLLVTDGSGYCWVSLHRCDPIIPIKSKRFKPKNLLLFMKDLVIDNFPFDKLDKKKTIRVEESWIPQNNYLYLYGEIHRVAVSAPASEVMKLTEGRNPGGRLDVAKLSAEDWNDMVTYAKAHGDDEVKILTSKYSDDPEDQLIISLKGDRALNTRSYLSIIGLFVAILMILTFSAILIKAAFPEIWEMILKVIE